LCPEQALRSPVAAKPTMILAVDFIINAGNERGAT
jgi:hypothetical protein